MATPNTLTPNTNTVLTKDTHTAFLYIIDGVFNVSPVLFLWISISRQIETSYNILPFCVIGTLTGTIFAFALSSMKSRCHTYPSRIFLLMFLATRSALGVIAIVMTLGRKSVLLVIMFCLSQLLHSLHDFIFVRLFCKLSFFTILVVFCLWGALTEESKENSNQTIVNITTIQIRSPMLVTCILFVIVHVDACYVAFARTSHCKTTDMIYRFVAVILLNATQFALTWCTHYYFKVSFFTSMIFSVLTLGVFIEALHDSVQSAIMAAHLTFAINANQSYVMLIAVFASIITLLNPYTVLVLGVICTASAILMVLLEYPTTCRLYT
jgi:hypothetical protein